MGVCSIKMSLPRLNVNSLNKEFLLFRNNAVQKRRFQGAKVSSVSTLSSQ